MMENELVPFALQLLLRDAAESFDAHLASFFKVVQRLGNRKLPVFHHSDLQKSFAERHR